MTGTCAVCNSRATQCCSSCRTTFYCSRDHQKLHWKQHKNQCIAYKLCFSEKLGNHLVAARDIQPNEVILREDPIVVGPKVVSLPICLGCGRRIMESYSCSGCGWPLCSSKCETSEHHVDECKLMRESGYKHKSNGNNGKKEAAYCSIVPIRCLLLKKSNPGKFEQIMKLESHLEERQNTPLYKAFKTNIVDFCREILGMKQYEEELILTVAAILDTNSFEIRVSEGDKKLRGLYPTAAMLAHDCTPKTKHSFHGETFTNIVTATVPIKKGEIITTTYTQTLWGTLTRRQHLRQAKCFDCTCERCEDPTEFRTYLGAIYCSRCKEQKTNGLIVSTSPLDSTAAWSCEVCGHTLTGRQMVLGNEAIRKEITNFDRSKGPEPLEKFLERYSDTLHPTNYHVVEVKYALTQIYGNMPGYLLKELNDCKLERKINLCTELLEIMDKLSPGVTRIRGMLLYELQAAMAVQAKRDFNNEKITKSAAQELLTEAMTLLQEAATILHSEPDMTKLLEEKISNLAKEMESDS